MPRPPRIFMPNFPMKLKLKPTPRNPVPMPAPGTEGTFKTNDVVFETTKKMTKIEAKLFLESAYGLHVAKVNSLVKRYAPRQVNKKVKKDLKRFYVMLDSDVELPSVPKRPDKLVIRPVLKKS